jgi:hypothetical protein
VAIARQRRGKHASAATNQHATIEQLLEAVFFIGSCKGYIASINGSLKLGGGQAQDRSSD